MSILLIRSISKPLKSTFLLIVNHSGQSIKRNSCLSISCVYFILNSMYDEVFIYHYVQYGHCNNILQEDSPTTNHQPAITVVINKTPLDCPHCFLEEEKEEDRGNGEANGNSSFSFKNMTTLLLQYPVASVQDYLL